MKFLANLICAIKNKGKRKIFDIQPITGKAIKVIEVDLRKDRYIRQFTYKRLISFGAICILFILLISSLNLIQKGLEIKGKVLGTNISVHEQLDLVQKAIPKINPARKEFMRGINLEKLPALVENLRNISKAAPIIAEALGESRPQKYLLIFQNNQEMRATGGFIGTYGILDIKEGKIKNLFIDGVYNADGQLLEKIIPPEPIKKISASWSMHDANWFPDWPTSASKIVSFYEKTGGATPDGVISFTPTAIEKILDVTGPIEMPEYNLVINSGNFIETIQWQTEKGYDKKLNQPKKILADFAPKLLNKISNLETKKMFEILRALEEALEEKHILIFSFDPKIQNFITEKGWAGQVLKTDKDYLSVINSNINGYKTDGVIDERIEHLSEIQPDGTIIDTVIITRRHNGGNNVYDWYNKVNCDWMRVYVPQGSELLEAQGHTIEKIQTLKEGSDYPYFEKDPLVSEIEATMIVDEDSGTKIFQESGKTVFANWVFVSPGETVTVVYKYKLPFKIDFSQPADSWSLLVQKQSGSLGSKFKGGIKIPEDLKIIWRYPDQLIVNSQQLTISSDLKTDRFYGVVLQTIN